jgi:hypothetical protein
MNRWATLIRPYGAAPGRRLPDQRIRGFCHGRRLTAQWHTREFRRGLALVAVCLGLIGGAITGSHPAQAFVAQDPPSTAPDEPPSDAPPDDLGEKLIRKTVQEGEEDVMARIMRHMAEAARMLDVRFDPGAETQSVQRRALDLLDEAIAQAAAQRRPQSSQGQSSHPDKRTAPDQSDPQNKRGTGAQPRPGASAESGSQEKTKSDVENLEAVRGRFNETRRSWGMLPQRDRDEVIQGIEERFLERYRKLIEDYYRALQGEDDAP